MKTLTINASNTDVEYIVDATPRVVMESLPNVKKPVISVDGTTTVLSFAPSDRHFIFSRPSLKIYGPKLETLIVKQGSVTYTSTGTQDLTVQTQSSGSVSIQGGRFQNLIVTADNGGTLDASNATVQSVIADVVAASQVTLGTVKTLATTQPESCPVGQKALVIVEAITSDTFTYNATSHQATSFEAHCGAVQIGENAPQND
jgi:hypothetical protein